MRDREVIRLGTRRSLLALTQSGWVADQIKARFPKLSIELVGIETRGDRVLDIPLSQIEGKEFFVAELDHALRDRRVDLTVHSMKDLSLDRPPEFRLGAIPRREDPRDLLILRPNLSPAQFPNVLKIGTSSPRRIHNLARFLPRALPPNPQGAVSIDFVEIRGNVNTRLGRLREPAPGPKALDGVILAAAGLARLSGSAEVQELLKDCRVIRLPLSANPTAPAQGALAVECRADDHQLIEILAAIHDPRTADLVAVERQELRKHGGGCHQAFGASAIAHPELGPVLWVLGRAETGDLDELRSRVPEFPKLSQAERAAVKVWESGPARAETAKGDRSLALPLADELRFSTAERVFIAHHRAVTPVVLKALQRDTPAVWVSGQSSWLKLAKLGVWVEGCFEGLGFSWMDDGSAWTIVTHDGETHWDEPRFRVLATYSMHVDQLEIPTDVTDVFWTSGSQFDAYMRRCENDNKRKAAILNVRHACGPGKTTVALRKRGIEPLVFANRDIWKRWTTELRNFN